MGLNPQIRNAADAYTTPGEDSCCNFVVLKSSIKYSGYNQIAKYWECAP
jgi:hypothetical protein